MSKLNGRQLNLAIYIHNSYVYEMFGRKGLTEAHGSVAIDDLWNQLPGECKCEEGGQSAFIADVVAIVSNGLAWMDGAYLVIYAKNLINPKTK